MTMDQRTGRAKPVVVMLLTILLLVGMLTVSWVAYFVWGFMGFGGFTPQQCVRRLRNPYNFLAVQQCIWFGDRVLPHLQTEFQNYEGIAGILPAKHVAVILGSIQSETALGVL